MQSAKLSRPRGFGAISAPAAAGHDFARVSVGAPVQRQADGDATADVIRGAAREGVRAAHAPLPFADRIQRAFGRHAVSNVRAHVGPLAARTTQAMQADAFAMGDHVVFGQAPSLHMAAHEAAHVVQQRAGARPAGGIGREGDALERHADAVARRVAAGGSAEPLLDRVPGAGAGPAMASPAAPVQRGISKTPTRRRRAAAAKKGKPVRVKAKLPGAQPKVYTVKVKADGTVDPKEWQRALLRPQRPKFRNKDVNKVAQPIKQPVATVKKADPVGYDLPLDLGKQVDAVKETQGTPKRIDIDRQAPLRQFTGVKLRSLGVGLTGGNQGGLYPSDTAQQHDLPEVADYQARRPEQVLSQFSEVFLHSAQRKGKQPVETQFGYGRKADKNLDLFASTNNQATQELLLKHLKNPVKHLKRAAKSDDPQLQKAALKLLFFKEQQQARLQAIKGHRDEAALREQLELAGQVHASILGGNVNVVVNPHKRHAEQNIADAIHGRGGYQTGEIAGAKIRCEGCSSELGYNLQDEHGHKLVGRAYASQAESARHQSTADDISRGRTRVVTNRSARSRSHSPPPRAKRK